MERWKSCWSQLFCLSYWFQLFLIGYKITHYSLEKRDEDQLLSDERQLSCQNSISSRRNWVKFPFLRNFVGIIENRKMKVRIQTMLGDIVVLGRAKQQSFITWLPPWRIFFKYLWLFHFFFVPLSTKWHTMNFI